MGFSFLLLFCFLALYFFISGQDSEGLGRNQGTKSNSSSRRGSESFQVSALDQMNSSYIDNGKPT